MKLSISNIAWNNSEDEKILRLLPNYGFLAIEIAPTKVWKNLEKLQKSEVVDYKNFWNKHGVKIIAFQSLLYGKNEFNIFYLDKRSELLAYLEKVLWIGNILGIKTAVFGSPKNRIKKGLSQSEAEKIALDFFNELAEIGKKYKIKIAIEPNPKEYGADFLLNTVEVLNFVKKINHPFVQLNLDTGILTLNNEKIEQSIKQAFPFLAHFHISEPYLDLVNESGNIAHNKIAKILKKLKYKNYCSIEMKAFSSNNLRNIKRSLSFVSKIYG